MTSSPPDRADGSALADPLGLGSVGAVRALLARHRLRPRHRLGQHFLVSRRVLERLVAAVAPAPGSLVLEIGPGLGSLTRPLLAAGARLLAIELDPAMLPVLAETAPGAEVIAADALEADLAGLLAARLAPGERATVAANLPYYVTTPILMRLLEEPLPVDRAVVMVQREVAERIVAGPGGRQHGVLSLAVAYRAVSRVLFQVPRRAFHPSPEVDSAVVQLTLRDRPPVDVPREPLFTIIRAAFGQRRKTLSNALAGLAGGKAVAESWLARAGIDGGRRAETLSLEEFAQLARAR